MTEARQDEPEANRTHILMIGPLPPPFGGMANFVYNIKESFTAHSKCIIKIHRTGARGTQSSPITQFLHDLRQLLNFLPEQKEFHPNIAHIHTASYYSFIRNIPYALICKYLSKAHIVIHIHGGMFMEFYNEANTVVKFLVRITLKDADAIIVTSPSWIKVIENIIGPGKKVISLPNGFDPNIFHPTNQSEARKTLGIQVDSKVLVTVGSLEAVKGHRYLVDAMQEICNQAKDVHLYILGDGTLREQLATRVKELGLENLVLFRYDSFPPSMVALWMSASDVFVLPSLNEGNPTVMFEALGCGRPFVGTKVGGVPDVIKSDDLGLLCEPEDAHTLAVTIVEALNNRWNHQIIADMAQRYTWASVAAQLKSAYEVVLQKDNETKFESPYNSQINSPERHCRQL